MADEACGNCRYYIQDDKRAECHRRTPFPFVLPATMMQAATVIALWPTPPPHEWCAEWRSRAGGNTLQFAPPLVDGPST